MPKRIATHMRTVSAVVALLCVPALLVNGYILGAVCWLAYGFAFTFTAPLWQPRVVRLLTS